MENDSDESLAGYKTFCPECYEILTVEGLWEEGELYSCSACGKHWKWSEKQGKWTEDKGAEQ